MSNATLEPPPLPEPDWPDISNKAEAHVTNETLNPVVSAHGVVTTRTENHEEQLTSEMRREDFPVATVIKPHETSVVRRELTQTVSPTEPHSEHSDVHAHETKLLNPKSAPSQSVQHGDVLHDEQLRQQTHHLEEALVQVKQDLKMVTDYMSRVEAYLPQVEALLKPSPMPVAMHSAATYKAVIPESVPDALVIKPQTAALKTAQEPHHSEPKFMTLDVKPVVTPAKPESAQAVEPAPNPESAEKTMPKKEIVPETPTKSETQPSAISTLELKEQEEKRTALTTEISRLKQKIEQTKTYLKGLQDQGGRRQELINKIEKESKMPMVQVEKMLSHDSEEAHLEEEYKLLLLELAPYREKLKVLQQKQNEFGNLSVFQFGEWKRLKAEIEALQGELAPFRTQVDRARSIYNRIKDLPRWREMVTELQKLGDLGYLNEAKPAIVNDITSMEDMVKQHETELAKLSEKKEVATVKV